MIKQFFKGFKNGMELFGSTIASIVNSVLLLIVYLVAVGITWFFAKLFRKHFLNLKLSKKSKTYWQDLNLKKKSEDKYYRTF